MKSAFIKRHGVEGAIEIIKQGSKDNVFISALANTHGTTPYFLRKFIAMHMPGFEYARQSSSPKEYKWLIDGDLDKTVELITHKFINEDRPFNYILKMLGADRNQLINVMKKFVPNKTDRRYSAPEEVIDIEAIENRYFSINVIGSSPEALDRLQGVA